MRRLISVLLALSLVVVGMLTTTSVVAADPAFLCPVVGDGVLNADAHNGDHGVSAITPPVGTSLLPGNNQAGAKANWHALNTLGPGASPGPGNGNRDWSPIWPPSP
jgi:hypothetical protein